MLRLPVYVIFIVCRVDFPIWLTVIESTFDVQHKTLSSDAFCLSFLPKCFLYTVHLISPEPLLFLLYRGHNMCVPISGPSFACHVVEFSEYLFP